MKNGLKLPVISNEIAFFSRNSVVADAIYTAKRGDVDGEIQRVTQDLYDRADEDVCKLVTSLSEGIGRAAKGLMHIKWKKFNYNNWYLEGAMSQPGPKKRIAAAGVRYGYDTSANRLIAYLWIIGGREATRNFVRQCQSKYPDIYMSDQDPSQKAWFNSSCVVWFDQPLTPKKTFEEVRLNLELAAAKFLKVAKAVFKKRSYLSS